MNLSAATALSPALTPTLTPALPTSLKQAAIRGARCICPRCGEAKLFRTWIKPVATCPSCKQDWSLQRADDFPAYISIFVTGHLVAPPLVWMIRDFGMSAWVTLAVILPLAVVMMLSLLQPAKGAVIALQWWMGMEGFKQERAATGEEQTKLS